MGSSEAAFHGVFQCRRGGASRWARPRRLPTGFCRAAAAVLPDGLVRGGLLRGFETAALRAAPPFPFVLLSPPPGRTSFFTIRPPSDTACARRGDASRWARPRRPRTAHPPCSCARLLLFAAAPAASLLRFPPRFAFRAAHSCARVPSAPVSSVPRRLVPRRRALCPALFLRGRTHRAVLSPFPSRAARLSCPAPPVRPACAHRVETGEAVKPAAARSAHARPCSCAGGRIAPFFRLSPRAPRAFLALRPLCARPVCIASRRGKL